MISLRNWYERPGRLRRYLEISRELAKRWKQYFYINQVFLKNLSYLILLALVHKILNKSDEGDHVFIELILIVILQLDVISCL